MFPFRHKLKVILLAWLVSLGIVLTTLALFLNVFVITAIGLAVSYLSSPTYEDRDEGIGILAISFVASLVIISICFALASALLYKTHFLQKLWTVLERHFIANALK